MKIRIALVGNPNCGKTTMFNELTGSNQYVGNWPGVTVEKKEGKLRGHKDVVITDLPGIYSLSPYTLDEVVSRDYLVDEKPDAIINLVDGTNLERNLFLTTQLVELGIPTVLAINMMDIVQKNGDKINIKQIEKAFGCKVVLMSALKKTGLMTAAEEAIKLSLEDVHAHTPAEELVHQHISKVFTIPVEEALEKIITLTGEAIAGEQQRWFAVKLFERDEKIQKKLGLSKAIIDEIDKVIARAETILDDDAEAIITNERYDEITSVMEGAVKKGRMGLSTSDKIDRIVTNRFLALPIFAAIMFLVYFVSVTTIGTIVTDWTNDVFFGEWIQPAVKGMLENVGAAEWLNGLIVDGIIGGVGAVLGFVPQMFILFFFLSFLEDCGYMARVAFIMDRVFRKFGLSGKSFIPMLISSGCGVPGVMATKTIENEKDRRMTIMTTTFIPCGAKLPVIALIAGAIMGGAWWMAPSMYFVGILAVVASGIMLKKMRMFAGDPAPFVMELPQYHRPASRSVLMHMWERCKAFVIKAGTVIFVACGVIWFLSAFGWSGGSFGMVEVEDSILAAMGHGISWIFAPLGFGNWQAAVATISGLVAKENVVGTFGVLQGMADATEGDAGLWASVATLFPVAAGGASFLIFNLLCAPCFAAIGSIKREMNSAKWTTFALVYQTTFAYGIALMVYQFGKVLTGGSFGIGTVAAIIVLGTFIYLLFRKPREEKLKGVTSTC